MYAARVRSRWGVGCEARACYSHSQTSAGLGAESHMRQLNRCFNTAITLQPFIPSRAGTHHQLLLLSPEHIAISAEPSKMQYGGSAYGHQVPARQTFMHPHVAHHIPQHNVLMDTMHTCREAIPTTTEVAMNCE